MRDHTGPHDIAEEPDDGRPPLHAYCDLDRLEDALQRLQQMLEDHDEGTLGEPLQVTHEAVALAQSLLHGWQVQQAVTQACLTRWEQTMQALETTGLIMQIQAETLRQETTQRRGAAWWTFLAGVGLIGMIALGVWRPAPPVLDDPVRQTRRPMPALLETI